MAHAGRYVWFGVVMCVVTSAPAAPPRDRPWIEQVERERDRGVGRVEDESTWLLRRREVRHDIELGRLKPLRPFEEFDEERERERQLDRQAQAAGRAPRLGEAARAEDRSVVLRQPTVRGGSVGPSPLATVVAREQRELAEAREAMERSVRAVDAAEARALRALRRRLNREGRPQAYESESRAVRRRHEELREGHRVAYERVRTRIVGSAPQTQ